MGEFHSAVGRHIKQILKMPARKPEQEKEVLDWIGDVLGEPVPAGDFEEVLKNGVILCKLMNKISPGAVPKFKEKGMPFILMENIQSFLKAAKTYGVPDTEVFQTPDLFEARNVPQVVLCIYSLARTTQSMMDHPWDQKWPQKINEILQKKIFEKEE